ncbi:serine hydrolase domain-containing protein [Microbulbifer sp. TRSA001]|uniref:serine hydrolase domain-containing protein n=1 Tax=Microbulbifer sp. TRSA001 TaxID=3243381 RepID=UPI004039A4A7
MGVYKFSWGKLLVGIAVLFLCGVGMHSWMMDYKKVLRKIYPLSASLSLVSVRCSVGAPDWMDEMIRLSVWEPRALSSQVAYISAEGRLHHCEMGWSGSPFISEPVGQQTRFLYGSMTKPITSAALLLAAERDLFSLDTPLVELLNIEGDLNNLKLNRLKASHLMMHQSGLQGKAFGRKESLWCPYNMPNIVNASLSERAFEETSYSNLGYCILGEVLSEVYQEGYRETVEKLFDLESRGILFASRNSKADEVWHDYRYNSFYGKSYLPRFDYEAVSATAGMTGSATAYALLLRDILQYGLPGYLSWGEKKNDITCDAKKIRSCYGVAFYLFQSKSGRRFNVKEGYMPGAAGIVAVNERSEVFVWLGNSDTLDAVKGRGVTAYLDFLGQTGF